MNDRKENLDFIQRQKSRVVDELQMKYAVINQNIQDLGLDYGDAVAKYDSEFDQSIKMIELVRGIKRINWMNSNGKS